MKLFLSDLDGTLLPKDLTISKEDINAINLLNERGISFGLATGRDLHFCKRLADKYNLNINTLIANNGATLIYKNKVIHEEKIENYKIDFILEKLLPISNDLFVFEVLENEKSIGLYNEYTKQDWNRYTNIFGNMLKTKFLDVDIRTLTKDNSYSFYKISMYVINPEKTTSLLCKLKKMFENHFEILQTSYNCIELSKKGVNKANTAEILFQQTPFTKETTSFIGDGENDIGLINLIPKSYVIETANQVVKEKANYIVKSVSEAILQELKIVNGKEIYEK